jgi:hypothetical protein
VKELCRWTIDDGRVGDSPPCDVGWTHFSAATTVFQLHESWRFGKLELHLVSLPCFAATTCIDRPVCISNVCESAAEQYDGTITSPRTVIAHDEWRGRTLNRRTCVRQICSLLVSPTAHPFPWAWATIPLHRARDNASGILEPWSSCLEDVSLGWKTSPWSRLATTTK